MTATPLAAADLHIPVGAPVWMDLVTSDVEASIAFYTELFGWQLVEEQVNGDLTYVRAQIDGKDVCAMYEMPTEPDTREISTHTKTRVASSSGRARSRLMASRPISRCAPASITAMSAGTALRSSSAKS